MANGSGVKAGVLLGGAVIFGVIAAIVGYIYLEAKDRALEARKAEREASNIAVVVANDDLPEGTVVGAQFFSVRPIPGDLVHRDTVLPGEFEAFEGRYLTTPLAAGTSLLRTHLDERFPVDFSDTIPVGSRAITVQVDELDSIAGLVRAGNRVDLFVHLPVRASGILPASLNRVEAEKPPGSVVVPLVQDVFVLATGKAPYQANLDSLNLPQDPGDRRFSTLTLQVEPEQAALIETAREAGDLMAILRNREDRGVAAFDAMTSYEIALSAVRTRQKEAMAAAAAAAGATINENGDWVMADGTVVKGNNVVLNEDGTVTTADGRLLGAKNMHEMAAAVGATINENGDWVMADGTVVKADDVVVNGDGTITTRNGTLLSAHNMAELAAKACATIDENGDWALANGTLVKKDDIVINADGTIATKSGQLLASDDLKVNANCDFVDADGNVIARDELVVMGNGTIMTKDGTVVSGEKVTRTKDGFLVAEDGTVMTADGKILNGVRMTKDGRIVSADGTVLKADNLVVNADGSVTTKDGTPIGGVSASNTRIARPSGLRGGEEEADAGIIALIVGGSGSDGVATVKELEILTKDAKKIGSLQSQTAGEE